MIASCGYLEDEPDSVETLGVVKRTRVKRLGVKEKSENQ